MTEPVLLPMSEYIVGDEAMAEQTADAILKQMDEQLIELIGVDRSHLVVEPELEVHVDEAQHTPKMIHHSSLETSAGLSDITFPSSRHMLLDYPMVLDKRRNPELTAPIHVTKHSSDRVSLSSMSSALPSLARCETTLLLEDDDDDVSLLVDDEEPPSTIQVTSGRDSVTTRSIQDAVDAIREEASRVEAALAIDQVQTMQNECFSMRKLLRAQADQIEHLKKELKLKDDKLAMMELERDLFKADMDALEIERRLAAADRASTVKRQVLGSPLNSSVTQSSSGGTFQTAATHLQQPTTERTSLASTPETVDLRSLANQCKGKATQMEELAAQMNAKESTVKQSTKTVSEVSGRRSRTQLGEIGNVSCPRDSTGPACVPSSSSKNQLEKNGDSPYYNRENEKQETTGSIVPSAASTDSRSSKPFSVTSGKNFSPPGSASMGTRTCKPTSVGSRKTLSSSIGTPSRHSKLLSVKSVRRISLPTKKDGIANDSQGPSYTKKDLSEGTPKGNRSAKDKKAFSKEFRPIQPGPSMVTKPQVVAAPVPRKANSPSTPQIQSEKEAKENKTVTNPPKSRERICLMRTVEKTGAFPTLGSNEKTSLTSRSSESESCANQSKSGISAIFRRRKGNKKESVKRPSCAEKARENRDSLQTQVDELAQRLKNSVEGSEELRLRLAMISRYYECTVHRLHENIVSLKKEQAAMKVGLTKQIKSIDRERLLAIKRNELMVKEQQIAKFRRQKK
ncbi:expressed unknown protein [Seminavis robusta]|uniref:Uncharacterized protein n=1 Tax=Seminavis robusta TaxID=568900 RepID=A0A9N8DLP6_9STRA|nr:expressed unknown protein [Seminavis robusta]|eukprot:Sro150_g068900.1 n/a (739) ;mRNA; f:75426-77642